MVRETRHLWVGNLPDNIREDRIREHFKRYGRVQNVKLLGRMENATVGANGSTTTGVCATVAFMDIKSASKAHNVEHVLDERTLTTEYYEPAAIPSAAGAPSAGSSPAGSGYSGSSSSVNSTPAPVAASRYHLSGEESAGNACAMAASAAAPATWRGTNDSATEYCRRGNTPASYTRYQRNNSNAPYATPPSNIESRSTPHHRWYASGERASAGAGAGAGGTTGGESTPSTPGGAGEVRRRHSGSGSSRSDSSSPEPSDTSRASTPAAPPPLAHHSNHRTPPGHPHQRASTANGRPLAICVRNLPARSTDSSLKDGLYHEYKKHGKVVWVKVVGQSADRYAVVRFKKPSDVDKALEVSQDKLFFGCKISVAPHQNCDEDCETAKPYETDIDEYHPKATRTLFIGNLEKDVTQQQLRDKFKHFGRIIEIDIKKGSGGGAGYAFCQYASISSVVEAIRAMDGEYVGGSRVKLGFGKPVATTCVWVDGLTEHTEKQVLGAVSRCGAATSVCVDRAAGAALVHFEQAAAAGAAVRELRRVAAHASAAEPDHPRLCVDYASRECQEAFYEQLEKHGGTSSLTGAERLPADSRYPPASRHDPLRVYDELGSSPQTDEAAYEDRLQSVVVSPHRTHRHRRDSSPEERKHSKERHRSVGGSSRRSRSGSRGSRHATRRRHRRRRDGSGSRAGTPLRDEPDTLPAEPRRPPRDRPPLPMSLPLPKFAVQLLRQAPPAPRRAPAPAPAPDSPPRPPSASSSSAGSAPHSPSLEERIRSLDEKYERWSGSARAPADAPDRARLRHRLLEIDINEVKPSEVVRSLLAKRSVFDEDSERLEGAVRAPSPGGSPRPRGPPPVPRTLRYPFPSHAPHEHDADASERAERHDRPVDPRLARADRPERTAQPDRLLKLNEADYRMEPRPRPRTPSTDGGVPDVAEPTQIRPDRQDLDGESTKKEIGRRRSSCYGKNDDKNLNCIDAGDILEALCEKQNIDAVPSYESLDKPRDADRQAITEKLSYSEEIIKTTTDVLENCFPTEYGDVSKPNLENEKPKSSWSQSEKQESIVASETLSSNESTLHAIQKTCELNTKTEVSLKDSIKSKTVDECKPEKTGNKLNTETEKLENSIPNHIDEEILSFHRNAPNHLNVITGIDLILKAPESFEIKNNENIHSSHNHVESFQKDKFQKENVEFEKVNDKLKLVDTVCFNADKKEGENEKKQDETFKYEREKVKQIKDKIEKEKHDNEKNTNTKNKNIKNDKTEKEKKLKDDFIFHKSTIERNSKKLEKDQEKIDDKHRDTDKIKHVDEKAGNHENHKKDRHEKDRSKHNIHLDNSNKFKKEEKHKHERSKRECDIKRDNKKDSDFVKSRKSSKDESARDLCRKDSTDSSASRTSHDSTKMRDSDSNDIREETKAKVTLCNDIVIKQEVDKDLIKSACTDLSRVELSKPKTKIEKGEENSDQHFKIKIDCNLESGSSQKHKTESIEKQRHYSFDSSGLDTKRKERLNSCSSLPSNIGHKRRMSSQDSLDCLNDDTKKSRNDIKQPERRDSKDSRSIERHKTTKFNKGHFAKIIVSKTKDDKKNQVKPPDDPYIQLNVNDNKETVFDKVKNIKNSPKDDNSESTSNTSVIQNDELQNNFDFLATLELRSSEEDERQKAMRKEMKEKKRIHQLQQIQELQMQQDALQQAEINKIKDDKKNKMDDKKKDLAREKRMSTDRKSKDEKMEHNKRKNRKQAQSTDTSDSDEPKKHSIFDIVDDGPTYISMYDKVKARSCKNMQKQEEEKRQEKIKAKFSQLKQSRAKREEKKRSSWDEDSDSEHERRKSHKTSLESSSEDDHMVINSKKRDKAHMSSVDYDIQKCNDYFSAQSNDEDSRNKLSRKNSRSRIMSDTSDDDVSKRNASKSPSFIDRIKREIMSDSESNLSKSKDSDFLPKESCEDKIKRTSLLNLFGKSDSDDCKLKANFETESEYNVCYPKSISNDISSETESISSSRNVNEQRKKHKKKQKRHKCSYSDEEFKVENSNDIDGENKARYAEKNKRHGNRKDKRKDKIRESVDTDEVREDKIKIKKEKISPVHSFDGCPEISPNTIKKEGKMEDIFGPLSDDSDKETNSLQSNKLDYVSHNYEPILSSSNDKLTQTNEEIQQKDDLKRRKEKKRKEKRYFVRDDENSLDVDAVSKAIEARLFADTPACETRIRVETIIDNLSKTNHGDGHFADHIKSDSILEKHAERLKRESREKERKKKKKRNKEDRQSRKEHHHFYHNDKDIILEKFDAYDCARDLQIVTNTMLLDIPLPNDDQVKENIDKTSDSLLPSPSLPCLTESPSLAQTNPSKEDIKIDNIPDVMIIDDKISNDYEKNKCIEVHDIPMPPPFENIVQNICDVPLPKDPVPILTTEPTITESIPIPSIEIDVSSEDSNENAVRSISNLEDDSEKQSEKVDALTSCKVDKKLDEKPRAIISQEETEDAVAALLGESFGGKDDSFGNCYEETENNPTNQIEIECTTNENENIPEEDAEEMRQAVQNLNASEMEMKPDTPVSDNDLLLIDTDTEEAEDTPQDAIERLPINIIATNQSLTNNSKSISVPKTADVSSVSITKPKPTSGHSLNPENETNVKMNEKEIKIPLIKRESIHHLTTIATSTGTPVITSWTLSSNAKTIESQIINIPASSTPGRDSNESRAKHVTANIVQIKSPQGQNLQIHSGPRPPTGTIRANTPYQVINQIARPPTSAAQPPTIKIPEAHVPLQRAQAVGLSPRPHSPRAVSVVSAAGGVTVVRVQPPLSPHARPAVLLQPAPLHFARLPVAPVLAPLSRAPVPAPEPHVPGVLRVEKVDPPVRPPAMLPVGAGSPMPDRRESPIRKVENHVPFGSPPVIHVAGVDRSVTPVVQNCTKPIVCSLQQPIAVSRAPSTNVIHAPQRLLTTAPMTSVIQLDPSRLPSSVLSMATIKHPTVLTKSQPSHVAAVTTSSISKVVMTPVLLKTPTPIRLSPKGILASNTKCDSEQVQNVPTNTNVKTLYTEEKNTEKTPGHVDLNREVVIRTSSVTAEPMTKCETDFEELLKDTTNEIKVTNNSEKKLEINVGKSITIMTHSSERRKSIDAHKSDITTKYDSNQGEENKQDKKLVNDITESIDSKIPTKTDVIQGANNPADTHRLKEGEIGVIVENNENVPSDKNNETPKNGSNNEESNITEAKSPTKDSNEDVFDSLRLEKSENKNLDENEFWSAKDVNIESVIKKVDSLCDESSDLNVEKEVTISNHDTDESNVTEPSTQNVSFDETELSKNVPQTELTGENITSDEPMTEKPIGTSKRGGRSVRGKKSDRAPDRVQTRQISKPARGTGASKRGRGRAKVDKKIKNLVTSNINNIPGDVYDFHEDSGDESASTKPENRPRLILTIKSPLSGQTNATPTSTLSITPKDAGKNLEKPTKDEKLEVFASPSMTNTRKSRRLQEKDVQRSTVDDVIDDVIKSAVTQPRANKDPIKKRATRQANVKPPEKLQGADTRKSPRGTKRIRDRSLSDASVDSNDDAKREDAAKDAKVPRLTEPPVAARTDVEPPLARPLGSETAAGVLTAMPAPAPAPSQAVIPAAVPSSTPAPPPTPTPAPAPQPMPIMKPPKKMISEKLAGAYDGAFAIGTATTTTTTAAATERLLAPSPERFPEVKGAKGAESAELRRPLDGVPGAMAGAAEATDARGQSPALPHRPPSAHRATPILIRGGDGDMGVAVAGVGGVAGVAGGVRGFRGAYAGPASLPRGAHHPQHSQHPPHSPHSPHALAKQPPQVIGSHHQLGTASRVTITSVPAVSPQGQMSLGDRGMYPHFSHQHYQVYQQHFRATQDQCRTSPYPRSLEAEGSEAPTPPLELRRPAGARVPRSVHSPSHSPAPHAHPAHSSHPAHASAHSAGHPAAHSTGHLTTGHPTGHPAGLPVGHPAGHPTVHAAAPAAPPPDRLIMYAVGCGRSPPPTYGGYRPASSLPPPAAPGPPHASQVPREADSLQMLLRRYPVMWQGLLALKNDSAAVQMHFVGGNPGVAADALSRNSDGTAASLLRIAQRMRLEQAQLDQVHRKMKMDVEHCMLLALPCGRDHMDVLQQSTNLTAGFITYLQRKQAAGIVNVAPTPGHQQSMYTVHIFPSCDFANENLTRIAPDLMHRVANIAHLLIVIATATT